MKSKYLAYHNNHSCLSQTPGHKVDELPSTFKTDIANKLLALIEQYRAVWLSRYLPGGLQVCLQVQKTCCIPRV